MKIMHFTTLKNNDALVFLVFYQTYFAFGIPLNIFIKQLAVQNSSQSKSLIFISQVIVETLQEKKWQNKSEADNYYVKLEVLIDSQQKEQLHKSLRIFTWEFKENQKHQSPSLHHLETDELKFIEFRKVGGERMDIIFDLICEHFHFSFVFSCLSFGKIIDLSCSILRVQHLW